MRRVFSPMSTLAAVLLMTSASRAHFNMLLPQTPSAKRGQEVTLVYQWGHPFEHQLFGAPAPKKVTVTVPGGTNVDVTGSLEKTSVAGAEGKKVSAYRLRFTPKTRGDYVFVLNTNPIWMAEEKVFFQDTVRVVLHVQDQEGWDAATGQLFEMVPLTRPYGLEPGMVFQAQVRAAGKPERVLVEIERYNPTPPPSLPPDEQITRTARTDPNGVVTCTLTEAGWWSLTAQRVGGEREHEGKTYPVRLRTTLWVFVDGKGGRAER